MIRIERKCNVVIEENFAKDKAKVLRKRWLIWGILCLAYIIVFFHRIAPSVVSDQLMREFKISGVALGSLAAMYYYIYSVMQIPSGILADTWGPRKMVALFMFQAGLGSLLFGYASNLTMAYVGRFLVGLGVSTVFVAIMKIQAEWFRTKEFGMMSGFTLVAGNLGAILGSVPLTALVDAVGWRTSFALVGLLTLLLSWAAWRWIIDRPQDAGWPSLGQIEGRKEGEKLKQQSGTLLV